MKLTPGMVAPAISTTSIHGQPLQLPDAASRFVHLQFRRFAGCPICNFHLHTLKLRIDEIQAAGIREVVVFHASTAEMLKYQGQLPFDCIADPGKALYRQFGVDSHWLAALHPRAMWAAMRGLATAARLPLRMEGGVTGLPADFLIDASGQLRAVHYGQHAYDNWDVDTLLRLAR